MSVPSLVKEESAVFLHPGVVQKFITYMPYRTLLKAFSQMAIIEGMCWKCGKPITEEEPISRSAECSFCHADLHCCKNCTFYAPGAQFDCHETVDEVIVDKERANFCDSFSVRRNFVQPSEDKAAAAKKAFDSLFGK